ncbi:MAG: cardiolipin synthase [Clostridiaceae bacterium]|nr:cardiolipin synthase [Clostridiaceae bacterium]
MEKKMRSDAAYEKWNRKNQTKGTTNYFDNEQKEESYLKGLKGRIQNNLSGLLRIILTALVVLFQFLIVVSLAFFLQSSSVYFYLILEICSIIAIVTLVNKNQSPSFRIAWISIVMLLPLSGFILFYLWGQESGKKKKANQYILKQLSYGEIFLTQEETVFNQYIEEQPIAGRMVKYMVNEGFPLTQGNDIKYYSMGEDAFEDIFRALEQAKEFIFIDFFIVAEGALWDKIYEILLRKLKQGVEIKFLYDDFGAAIRIQKFFRQILEHDGIEVHVFNPIHKYTSGLYMNFRSHQKIIVVDGEVGFTGGFNLADEYANLVDRFGIWKDTGIRVRGDAVWNLTVVFLQMWEASERIDDTEHIDYLKYKKTFPPKGDTFCQVISDGPANNPKNPIESIYNQMITFSDEYLYITTPYLILEDYMRQSLIEAAHRGVDVRIITPNIPDKKYAKLLTNYNYGPLLKEGVRIYEYTPGFMHAKQIATENSAIVGTINMDYRSFYLHYENGIWMSGQKIQQDIYNDFHNTFSISKEMTYKEWLNRPLACKMIQPVLNLFSTLF